MQGCLRNNNTTHTMRVNLGSVNPPRWMAVEVGDRARHCTGQQLYNAARHHYGDLVPAGHAIELATRTGVIVDDGTAHLDDGQGNYIWVEFRPAAAGGRKRHGRKSRPRKTHRRKTCRRDARGRFVRKA